MNKYTEKDIRILLENVTLNSSIPINSVVGGHLFKRRIPMYDIVQLFSTSIVNREKGLIHIHMLATIKEFLDNEPLKKVPLFINSLPDLAKWRLRIGK